jgi:hypothetical protein
MQYLLIIMFFVSNNSFASKMCSQQQIQQENCAVDLANYNKDYLCNILWANNNSESNKPCCRLVHCSNFTGGLNGLPQSFSNEWIGSNGVYTNISGQLLTKDDRGRIKIINPKRKCTVAEELLRCQGRIYECEASSAYTLNGIDEFQWEKKNFLNVNLGIPHRPDTSSPLNNVQMRSSSKGIKKIQVIGKFHIDAQNHFDDPRRSKLIGFADGLYNYPTNFWSNVAGWFPSNWSKWLMDEDDRDNIDNSCDVCPHKANSARIGYSMSNGQFMLSAYFYNNTVRRAKDMVSVKSNQCFIAEIGIDEGTNLPIGLKDPNGNYDAWFSETQSGNTSNSVNLSGYEQSVYTFKIITLDNNGIVQTHELNAPRTLVNGPLDTSTTLNLANNGGYYLLVPYHGGSLKPVNPYKVYLKLTEKNEFPASNNARLGVNTSQTKLTTEEKIKQYLSTAKKSEPVVSRKTASQSLVSNKVISVPLEVKISPKDSIIEATEHLPSIQDKPLLQRAKGNSVINR